MIRASRLKREFDKLADEKREHEFYEMVDTCFQEREFKPDDFSIRDLAENFMGREWVEACDPRWSGGVVKLAEAESAVDSTAFLNISGQIVYSKILENYNNPQFVGESLVETIPTRLSGEKIPGITMLGDVSENVHEGEPYPHAGVGEQFIETPETTKRGVIVSLTREAVFFDRTNMLVRNAGQVGETLGLRREKLILRTVLGIDNSYTRNGTTFNTFLTSGAYVNDAQGSAHALQDWTDIDEAMQLFDDMTDPDTGEPILVSGNQLLVPRALLFKARRIVRATTVRHTTGSAIETEGANPLDNFQVVSSPYIKSLLTASGVSASDADTYWHIGDPQRAFALMENWPITVVQAPRNSEAEFNQDIVMRWKASERSIPAVKDPRYMVRKRGHA